MLPGVGAFADLHGRPAGSRRHDRSASTRSGRSTRRQAVPRHLRRHAADGRRAAWSTASHPASAGSPATCRAIAPKDRGQWPQDPAYGLERARAFTAPVNTPVFDPGLAANSSGSRTPLLRCTAIIWKTAKTPISSIPTAIGARRPPTYWRPATMSGRSRRLSAGTIWWGPNFIPRRASSQRLAHDLANFLTVEPMTADAREPAEKAAAATRGQARGTNCPRGTRSGSGRRCRDQPGRARRPARPVRRDRGRRSSTAAASAGSGRRSGRSSKATGRAFWSFPSAS